MFSNPNDRDKYEENLEEEKKYKSPENSEFQAKGVDLMRKLTDYLGK